MTLDLGVIVGISAALSALVAVGALLAARRVQARSGLPRARVVYTDSGAGGRATDLLFSRRYGLVGKPDYLLEADGWVIPVEVKPTRRAAEPYPGDILQLLAYCLLVEEKHGRPAYGLLRYASATFRLDYTDAARAHLLETVAAIRAATRAGERGRSHDDAGRCTHCMFNEVCDESLAAPAD